jgi:hypothetical protein
VETVDVGVTVGETVAVGEVLADADALAVGDVFRVGVGFTDFTGFGRPVGLADVTGVVTTRLGCGDGEGLWLAVAGGVVLGVVRCCAVPTSPPSWLVVWLLRYRPMAVASAHRPAVDAAITVRRRLAARELRPRGRPPVFRPPPACPPPCPPLGPPPGSEPVAPAPSRAPVAAGRSALVTPA